MISSQNIGTFFSRTVLKEINQRKTQLVDFDDTKSKETKKEDIISNDRCKEDCQNNSVINVEKLLSFTSFVQNSKETYL